MKLNYWIKLAGISLFILMVAACSKENDFDPSENTTQNISQQNVEGLFFDDMWQGKYLVSNGSYYELAEISQSYFHTRDVEHFTNDPQPIISIVRERNMDVERGILVKIVNHYGQMQDASVLYDDGSRISIRPQQPLADGIYFVIDDYNAALGTNLHFLDYFYIWQNQDTELASLGKIFSNLSPEPVDDSSEIYYYVPNSFFPLTPINTKNWNNEPLPNLPVITESSLGFLSTVNTGLSRVVPKLGIKLDDDNGCKVKEITATAQSEGVYINDTLWAVNDVVLFSKDSETACWALRDFLTWQSPHSPFNVTVLRGTEEIEFNVLLDNTAEFSWEPYPLTEIRTSNSEIHLYQTDRPLLDGLYCLSGREGYYCFFKK
jgi:hypothetical protein